MLPEARQVNSRSPGAGGRRQPGTVARGGFARAVARVQPIVVWRFAFAGKKGHITTLQNPLSARTFPRRVCCRQLWCPGWRVQQRANKLDQVLCDPADVCCMGHSGQQEFEAILPGDSSAAVQHNKWGRVYERQQVDCELEMCCSRFERVRPPHRCADSVQLLSEIRGKVVNHGNTQSINWAGLD
jgi:hypothetical protein